MRMKSIIHWATFWFLIFSLVFPPLPPPSPVSGSPPVLMPFHPDLVEEWQKSPEQAPSFSPPLAGLKQAPRWPVLQAEGALNALLLLVDFDDKPSSVEAGYFDDLVFGTESLTVRDYFREVSFGKLDIVTVNLPSASDWFRAPENYDYYVGGQGGGGDYPRNAQRLVEDLVKLADPLIDFSEYDNNGDGYVDILMVVHAGTGREATGDNDDIHSHMWQTLTPVPVDDVKVHHYAMMPEYWPTDWAPLPNMTIGVFAHELGHIFGLPDLYDTDGSSHGVGRWCLMAAGSWNGLVNGLLMGSSPAHPSAWARIQLGWVAPAILTADLPNAQIEAVQDGGTIYRLWTDGSLGNEYFLVENRQPVGYDAALPGFGLLIWHIDEAMLHNRWEVLSHHNWHSPHRHYKVALEQADGRLDLENRRDWGDAGDPFPSTSNNRYFTFTTIPNSSSYYSSEDTLVAVANISDSAPTMTADLRVGAGPETGILVQVVNQDGEPARDAEVLAYSDISAFPDAWGWTDEDGFAWLNVPDGTYTLVASSSRDHFLVVKEGVSSPSSVIMDTQGTVRVEFHASNLEGNPLNASISLSPYTSAWCYVGEAVGGQLAVQLSPMTYRVIHAWSRSELYYFVKPEITLTENMLIQFNAATMPTGQVEIGLSDFGSMSLWFMIPGAEYWVAPVVEVQDGSRVVLFADTYNVSGYLRKTEAEGRDWHYLTRASGNPIILTEGSIVQVQAGGSFSVSTTPDKLQYSPGESVTISNLFTDGFGNSLEGVHTWGAKTGAASKPDQLAALAPQEHEGEVSFSPGALQSAPSYEWQVIYPRLVVTDPNGNEVVNESSWHLWWDYSFNLPHDAPPGEYTVELSLDTGPHEGVITAHNTFQVTGVPGDVNADGRVDPADLTLVAVFFNRRADDQGFDPGADLNNDGIVDIFDLVRVGRNFGTGGN